MSAFLMLRSTVKANQEKRKTKARPLLRVFWLCLVKDKAPPIYEIIKSAAVDFITRGGRKVYPRKAVPLMIHLSF